MHYTKNKDINFEASFLGEVKKKSKALPVKGRGGV
jgi:hypothetical protein